MSRTAVPPAACLEMCWGHTWLLLLMVLLLPATIRNFKAQNTFSITLVGKKAGVCIISGFIHGQMGNFGVFPNAKCRHLRVISPRSICTAYSEAEVQGRALFVLHHPLQESTSGSQFELLPCQESKWSLRLGEYTEHPSTQGSPLQKEVNVERMVIQRAEIASTLCNLDPCGERCVSSSFLQALLS